MDSPFDVHYGLELLECTSERVRAVVPIARHHLQTTGVVHGGVHASIAEAIASFGTNAAVERDGNVGLGLSNATSFLRPVGSGRLHALAEPRHRGRTTWVWDVDISDDRGRTCAVSRVTIAVRSRQ